ncbi:MAG TPA: AI-2E family transporter [Flavisolibacter sp.]|nr:AI-2E family transporter [Flavisolibacter sp.]
MERKENSKLAFYARIGLVLHAFLLSLLILYLGKILFIPLFFALLIAILLYPLTRMMERRMKKSAAAVLAVLLFLVLVGSVVFFFTKELVLFLKDLPKAQSKFLEIAENLQMWVSSKFNLDNAQQMDYLRKSANGLLSSAGSTFLGTLEFVVLFIFFLIFTYFILVHRKLLTNFILAFFDEGNKIKVDLVINSTRSMINNYVIGLLTEMAIMFTLILIILLILGVKYAMLIAVVAAVLNVIPYIGIYIAAAFAMLIALTNGTEHLAIYAGVSFIIVHFVDANILMPHIVGGRVKINPFITIVAVIMGKLIWGIPGMFLFIPLTAIIRIISENVHDLKPWSILIGEEK